MSDPRLARLVPDPGDGWISDAACRDDGPDQFYASVDHPDYDKLRWPQRCGRCPVRVDCLAHAMVNGETDGVWGGFTPSARAALSRLLVTRAVRWDQLTRTLQPPGVLHSGDG